MAKDIVMMDEGEEQDTIDEKRIVFVLSNSCVVENGIITMPISEALGVAANIAIQAGMLI